MITSLVFEREKERKPETEERFLAYDPDPSQVT